MFSKLEALLERVRNTRMTREQREEQRRSFAYGNSKIENDRITRETIDREAESMAAENESND
ncbi:MAG: hypothetical protein V3T27_02665 [Alphaproteobacteria bacterium]